MNTFNLALVVGLNGSFVGAPVVTIVCASEDTIDREKVRFAAMGCFQDALRSSGNLDKVFQKVLRGIQKEFGIQAVLVKADCAAIVSLGSV